MMGEPERDVLERLRHRAEWDTDEDTRKLCLDAIAEIEELTKYYDMALAELREYTEAEPEVWTTHQIRTSEGIIQSVPGKPLVTSYKGTAKEWREMGLEVRALIAASSKMIKPQTLET